MFNYFLLTIICNVIFAQLWPSFYEMDNFKNKIQQYYRNDITSKIMYFPIVLLNIRYPTRMTFHGYHFILKDISR